MNTSEILIRDLSFPIETTEKEILHEAEKKLRKVFSSDEIGSLSLFRRSVDCRPGRKLSFVVSVRALVPSSSVTEGKLLRCGAALLPSAEVVPEIGKEKMKARPVVVGFGPAGMFASLLLAENGYRPIVLERGGDVSERQKKVARFYSERVLDENTNIQFGAGGAGTFSDGKLVTRVNDVRTRYILRRFTEFGAPKEILTEAKPHIGTDKLLGVVSSIASRVESLGGEFHWHTRFESFDGKTVRTDSGEIEAGALILAVGNSACDTAEKLIRAGLKTEAKPISVGFRIEHRQSEIESFLYGKYAGDPRLPRASYSLSRRVGDRTVYSFCMCPGGEVVAATGKEGRVVTNGMSRFARDGENANAAILATLLPDEFQNDVFRMISFRDECERKAFLAGGSDYSAPVTTVGTFLDPETPFRIGSVRPSYLGGNAWKEADLSSLLPAALISSLREGLSAFGRIMSPFSEKDAILTGSETRTSSPWRFLRDEETRLSLNSPLVYPCGEGAGYAGGITSSALDGVATALAVMKKAAPYE